MSETKEALKYDLYDFTKSIYIFSHMKTILVDKKVQIFEEYLLKLIRDLTLVIVIFVLFKIIIIFGYFIVFQASIAFKNFIQLSYKSRCDISCKNSCKYFLLFFKRILKKIYNFNFYIIQNEIISLILLLLFLTNIILNYLFMASIKIEMPENMAFQLMAQAMKVTSDSFMKNEWEMCREDLNEQLYSVRNIFHAVLLAFGYFITLNIIIAFPFLYVRKYEYLYGGFMLNEPQRILNIIIFSILLILKIYCLYRIIYFNKESKLINLIF